MSRSKIELSLKCLDYYSKEKYENQIRNEEDAGLDLFCIEDQIIKAKSICNKINFGVQCEMIQTKDDITDRLSYILVPRSSTGSKTPLRLCNSIGIIDSGYRGNIMAFVDNVSDEDFKISKGDRLFQLCHAQLKKINDVIIVNTLSNSERGEKGFGSSGK